MIALLRKHSFDEVFDSQRVYRLILTAVSNPARVVNIREYAEKLFGEHPGMLALAFTLLDNEVSFTVCGSAELSEDISCLTISEKAALDSADYIFVTDPLKLEEAVKRAKCGTLRDPHKSATVIVKNMGSASCSLALSGPGIDKIAEIAATRTVKTALNLRDAQVYEYPQGIDFIFLSENGDMFAVPRLVRKGAL